MSELAFVDEHVARHRLAQGDEVHVAAMMMPAAGSFFPYDPRVRLHLLRSGPGMLRQHGQGKWYPGEQLPRWALSIFWRVDGQPCWHDPELFADERTSPVYTSDDAKRFIETLTIKLGLDTKFITPGYEDVWYYLWRERRLPVNVDPFESKLDDEMERVRLRRVFTHRVFVGRDVDAVDFVVGDVAFQPLDLRPHLFKHPAGGL